MSTAKTQIFLFSSHFKDWMEVKQVNLKDVLNGKNVNEDAMVMPGDMIYVPEKFIYPEVQEVRPCSLNAVASWYGDPIVRALPIVSDAPHGMKKELHHAKDQRSTPSGSGRRSYFNGARSESRLFSGRNGFSLSRSWLHLWFWFRWDCFSSTSTKSQMGILVNHERVDSHLSPQACRTKRSPEQIAVAEEEIKFRRPNFSSAGTFSRRS